MTVTYHKHIIAKVHISTRCRFSLWTHLAGFW